MPDRELYARLESAPPWVRETAELVRFFGLRRAEVLGIELANLDYDRQAIRFAGENTKSGRDEFAFPLPGGWEFVTRLAAQAKQRRQSRIITWPGPAFMAKFLAGKPIPAESWRPLKSIRRAWCRSAVAAEIEQPHRLHDVRARYITDVAKINRGIAKEAARHADPATTERYIAIAADEVAAALKAAPRPQKPSLRTIRGGRR
jgi:integrase